MQKLFLNLYPRRKYRTTTRVNTLFLSIWHSVVVVLKLATVIANPMDFQWVNWRRRLLGLIEKR
jgi:hypothetical protein